MKFLLINSILLLKVIEGCHVIENRPQCTCGQIKPVLKVIGGEDTPAHIYPWMVYLDLTFNATYQVNISDVDIVEYPEYGNDTGFRWAPSHYQCGGTIITSRSRK